MCLLFWRTWREIIDSNVTLPVQASGINSIILVLPEVPSRSLQRKLGSLPPSLKD